MEMRERNLLTDLQNAAAARGATVKEISNGHFHIRGALLVNYYPFARTRSAYLAGTTSGKKNVTPAEAVDMAFIAPPVAKADKKDSRSNQSRYARWKRRQWKAGNDRCHWCHDPCSRDPSSPLHMTVDHFVPLHRGGLDNPNNWVVAHHKCNQARGSDMPELGRS